MTACTSTKSPMRVPAADRAAAVPLLCRRSVDEDGRHKGDHEAVEHVAARLPGVDPIGRPDPGRPAWDSLVTWDTGGASGGADMADPAASCRCRDQRHGLLVGHAPEDHAWGECESCGITLDLARGPVCGSCSYWVRRAEAYANAAGRITANRGGAPSRLVVPHDHAELTVYVWSPGHGGAFGGRRYTVTWDDGETAGPADYLWYNGIVPWWLTDRFPPNAHVEADGAVHRPGHTTGFRGAGRRLEFNGGAAPA